ncbi:MAG: integrase core domain-containing protein [bacterium]
MGPKPPKGRELPSDLYTSSATSLSLPPRSPKLNGKVERMNRTLREEFWAFYEDEDNLEEMRAALRKWTQEVYAFPDHPGYWKTTTPGFRASCPGPTLPLHNFPPHLTPAQYLLSFKKVLKRAKVYRM